MFGVVFFCVCWLLRVCSAGENGTLCGRRAVFGCVCVYVCALVHIFKFIYTLYTCAAVLSRRLCSANNQCFAAATAAAASAAVPVALDTSIFLDDCNTPTTYTRTTLCPNARNTTALFHSRIPVANASLRGAMRGIVFRIFIRFHMVALKCAQNTRICVYIRTTLSVQAIAMETVKRMCFVVRIDLHVHIYKLSKAR